MARDLDEHFGEDLDTYGRRTGARAELNALVAMARARLADVDRDDVDAWADAVFDLDIPEDDGGFIAAAAPVWAQKQGENDAGDDSNVERLRWIVVALADADEGSLGALPLDDEELEDERVDPNEQRDEVVDAMAHMMWGLAYAAAWDEAWAEGDAERPPWAGGGRVEDYLPETPKVIREGARRIIDAAISRAGVSLQSVLEVLWDDVDGPRALGHDLACMWLGDGCGELSRQEVKSKTGGFDVGSGELVVFLVDGDPNTVEVNYFGGSGLK